MNITTTGQLRAALDDAGDLIARADLTLAAGLNWTGVRNISVGGYISADGDIVAGDDISAGGNILARGNILAGGTISADGIISADGDIVAGDDISAGGNILAGGNISAGGYISTDGDISAGDAISAGDDISAGNTIRARGTISARDAISARGYISAGGNISAGGTVRAYTQHYDANEPPISEQVARLDAVRDTVLADPDTLDMTTWHKCETTHCIAGWLQVQAGLPQDGEYAAADAARLAPIATGMFYASTARAWAWLKDREYAQEETR
jgi:hypothetical protein